MVATMAARYPRQWFAFRNERNRGMTANWNECLRQWRAYVPHARYITKIDSDDLIDHNLFEEGVRALDAKTSSILCHFRTITIGASAQNEPAIHALLGEEGGRWTGTIQCRRRRCCGFSPDTIIFLPVPAPCSGPMHLKGLRSRGSMSHSVGRLISNSGRDWQCMAHSNIARALEYSIVCMKETSAL